MIDSLMRGLKDSTKVRCRVIASAIRGEGGVSYELYEERYRMSLVHLALNTVSFVPRSIRRAFFQVPLLFE